MKLKNRKKLLSILSIAVLFFLTNYFLFFRTEFDKFMISEVNSYTIVDKSLFYFFTPADANENKTFQKISSNIKKAVLLNFDQRFNPKLVDYNRTLLLFNTGLYNAAFGFKFYDYFEKNEKIWVLKDKYLKTFQNLGFINEGEKVYVKKHGKNYIMGKNLALMKFYDKEFEKKNLNEKLVDAYKKGYVLGEDLSKEKRFGLTTDIAKGNISFENGKVKFVYEVYFKDKTELNRFSSSTQKTLAKYYNNEGLYFDVEGFNPLAFLIFLYSIDYNKQEEAVKNVNWKTIVDEASSEFYFIPDKNAVLIEHKDSEFRSFLFNIITDKKDGAYILGNQKLYVKGNFIHINYEFKENNEDLIKPDIFLKGRIRSKQLLGYFGLATEKLTNAYVDLEGKIDDGFIEISAEMDADVYKKYLQE